MRPWEIDTFRGYGYRIDISNLAKGGWMLTPHPLTAGLDAPDALEALLDSLEGIEFFVSVKDADKTGFLLGPYPTNLEAVQNVPRARELALKADAWSHFYAFGTCSAPIGTIPKTVFGK